MMCDGSMKGAEETKESCISDRRNDQGGRDLTSIIGNRTDNSQGPVTSPLLDGRSPTVHAPPDTRLLVRPEERRRPLSLIRSGVSSYNVELPLLLSQRPRAPHPGPSVTHNRSLPHPPRCLL